MRRDVQRVVVATFALGLAGALFGLAAGCGDADPCQGKCSSTEQCTEVPITRPGGFLGPKTDYVHYCLDPSKAIRQLTTDPEPATDLNGEQ